MLTGGQSRFHPGGFIPRAVFGNGSLTSGGLSFGNIGNGYLLAVVLPSNEDI